MNVTGISRALVVLVLCACDIHMTADRISCAGALASPQVKLRLILIHLHLNKE